MMERLKHLELLAKIESEFRRNWNVPGIEHMIRFDAALTEAMKQVVFV